MERRSPPAISHSEKDGEVVSGSVGVIIVKRSAARWKGGGRTGVAIKMKGSGPKEEPKSQGSLRSFAQWSRGGGRGSAEAVEEEEEEEVRSI